MKKLLLSTALLAAAIAVFGDWPYSQNLLDNAPRLLNSINSDREVSMVIHVGDIHSGKMGCTSAGILPPIPAANRGWNRRIYALFQQFKTPMVYTPGDNEKTNCHKAKELASGDPLKELTAVRSLFFARPSWALGLNERKVSSQAQYYDHAHPPYLNYLENMMWEDDDVVFVTVNMPGGSNDDASPWTEGFENPTAPAQEASRQPAHVGAGGHRHAGRHVKSGCDGARRRGAGQ